MLATQPEENFDLVVTDPPYNCGKDYGPLVDDNRPDAEYLGWYGEVAQAIYRVHADGYLYVSCTTPQLWTLRPIWEAAGYSWVMMLLWHGPNYAGNSNTVRQQWRLLYEPVMMFLKGPRLPMLNDVRGVNSDAIIRAPRPQRNFPGDQCREHVAQKPVKLYKTLIARTPGQRVLDPFVGSGASGLAADALQRDFTGIDLDISTASRRLAYALERAERPQRQQPVLL